MARTRAERRHNTHVKTAARKAIAYWTSADDYKSFTICGGKVSPNGEASSCGRCKTCLSIERDYNETWTKAQTNAFMMAIAE